MSIQIEELSFAYLNSPRQALSDVTLTCPEGQVTAIVGPTGAGKSTLLLTLNGLVPKEIPGRLEGSISIDGINIRMYLLPNLLAMLCLCLRIRHFR